MSMRIAVVNSKGGVAKTTTAIYLAAAARALGRTVEVRAIDRQGCAASWLEAASVPDGVQVARDTINSVKHSLGSEVQVLDTSPSNKREIDEAVSGADYVVIPSMPGQLNDNRALATWNYLNARGIPAAVLLTNVEARRSIGDTSKNVIEGGADMFETVIPRRTAIARSTGSWPKPNQLFGYDNVLKEIEEAIHG